MFCPNCGMKLSENTTSCANCKQVITQNPTSTEFVNVNAQQPTNTNPINNKSGNKKPIMLIIVVLIVVLVGLYFGKDYLFKNDNQNNNTNNNSENNNQNDNNNNQNNNNNNIDNSNVKPSNNAFLMPIEDVFTITGRGTVVTGQIERGTISIGDEIEILGFGEKRKVKVTSIEMFREIKDTAEAGDNVGLLLENVGREEVQRGQVLAKPDSIGVHTKFKANIAVLTKAEGGQPDIVFEGCNVQFYFRTTDISGKINVLKKVEPKINFEGIYSGEGDTFEISVQMEQDNALEVGTKFSIRSGGRTVGTGIVIEILN